MEEEIVLSSGSSSPVELERPRKRQRSRVMNSSTPNHSISSSPAHTCPEVTTLKTKLATVRKEMKAALEKHEDIRNRIIQSNEMDKKILQTELDEATERNEQLERDLAEERRARVAAEADLAALRSNFPVTLVMQTTKSENPEFNSHPSRPSSEFEVSGEHQESIKTEDERTHMEAGQDAYENDDEDSNMRLVLEADSEGGSRDNDQDESPAGSPFLNEEPEVYNVLPPSAELEEEDEEVQTYLSHAETSQREYHERNLEFDQVSNSQASGETSYEMREAESMRKYVDGLREKLRQERLAALNVNETENHEQVSTTQNELEDNQNDEKSSMILSKRSRVSSEQEIHSSQAQPSVPSVRFDVSPRTRSLRLQKRAGKYVITGGELPAARIEEPDSNNKKDSPMAGPSHQGSTQRVNPEVSLSRVPVNGHALGGKTQSLRDDRELTTKQREELVLVDSGKYYSHLISARFYEINWQEWFKRANTKWMCNCSQDFANKSRLEDHVWVKHLRKRFYCPVCPSDSTGLAWRTSIGDHVRHVHPHLHNSKAFRKAIPSEWNSKRR